MVNSPMMRRMMGADASDELAKMVLDEFSFKIRAAAESSKKGLSAKDVEGLIDDFMEKGRDKTLVHFQDRFEAVRRQGIWNRSLLDIAESLAHLLFDIRRLDCGIANAVD